MILNGIIGSSGLAMAPAAILATKSEESRSAKPECVNVMQEKSLLKQACQEAKTHIHQLIESSTGRLTDSDIDIFYGYECILDDDELMQEGYNLIEKEGLPASLAVKNVFQEQMSEMSKSTDTYLRQRADDYRHARDLLLQFLTDKPVTLDKLASYEKMILVADDLSPLQTALLDARRIKGIILNHGGETSHSSIIARSLSIPAIVGVKDATRLIKEGDIVVVDAIDNRLIINPDQTERQLELERIERFEKKEAASRSEKNWHCQLNDGIPIQLQANISGPDDCQNMVDKTVGVGLFRTEFLFVNRQSCPSEEEQFEIYKSISEQLGKAPITCRTMDCGGDKEVPYLNLPQEENPFLGNRGIRIGLRQNEFLLPQLRAILRASVFGSFKILLPMISDLSEIEKVKDLIECAKKQLRKRHLAFDESIQLGIMIETPASALLADEFIQQVDFISIGTNDLTQYCLAVDRGNHAISDLYRCFSPAVLKLIKISLDAAAKQNKTCSVCGEMAADVKGALLLVGLGVKSLSMSPSLIPRVRRNLAITSLHQLRSVAFRCLSMGSAGEVEAFLGRSYPTRVFH